MVETHSNLQTRPPSPANRSADYDWIGYGFILILSTILLWGLSATWIWQRGIDLAVDYRYMAKWGIGELLIDNFLTMMMLYIPALVIGCRLIMKRTVWRIILGIALAPILILAATSLYDGYLYRLAMTFAINL